MSSISNIKDLDIDEIFNDIINLENITPYIYPLEFDLNSIKELFEFLLQFTTMLCKHFYGNANGNVDLSTLNKDDFIKINNYLMCMGFTCTFQALPANYYNLNFTSANRYDKITITQNTKLNELIFGLRCNQILYVITFDFAPHI